MTTETATLTRPISIGPTIDKMAALRDSKRELEAKIKEIETSYGELETALLAKFEAEGSTKGAGKKASASVTETVVGNVTDWDEFCVYVGKKKYFHLFQRRLSDPGIRELFDKGVKVPGVEPFTKKRLNLRVI